MFNIPDKANGDTLTPVEYNPNKNDLQNIVVDAGIGLNGSDTHQAGQAISTYASNGDFYTCGGTANVLTLTAQGSKQAPVVYEEGMRFRFTVGTLNTGATTINVAGVGAKDLVSYSRNALSGGELVVDDLIEIIFDNTADEFYIVESKNLKTGTYEIQDYTTTGLVGASDQQQAGWIWDTTTIEAVLTNWSVDALYQFENGSLTVDDAGAYTLTNNNTVTDANGILNTGFGAELNGSTQYFTQATLLDVVPSNLVIGFVFKADDGQAAGAQYVFTKLNVNTQDNISFSIGTDGTCVFATEEGNNGDKLLYATGKLDNGANPWHFAILTWDTTYGKRMYIDGQLVGEDTAETTLMGNGTESDFTIGSLATGGLFDGKIASLFVANLTSGTVTQQDVDFLCATQIAEPAAIQGGNYTLKEKVHPNANANFEYEQDCEVVTKYDGNIYRAGYTECSDDTVKIIARTEV